jgi:DNA-binding NarL/FixJ family response regulator
MIGDSDKRNLPGAESGEILTSHERSVLALSATGLGIDDVAARLGRPTERARQALASVIGKLGARSKLEAVVIALNAGLIDLPDQRSALASQRRTDESAG